MRIHSTDDLSRFLAAELDWRRSELLAIKQLLWKQRHETKHLAFLARAGVALLYAHWEGYIKNIGRAYLEYVSNKSLQLDQLQWNFVAIICKKHQRNLSNPSATDYHDIVSIMRYPQKKYHLPYKDVIDTKSNLSYSVLQDILLLTGIEEKYFEKYEKSINEKLIKDRNKVAHGRFINFNVDDYIDLQKDIMEAMNQFKTEIENSVYLEKYKVPVSQSSHP